LVHRRSAPWLAVGTVCFGAFMGQLDASIVTLTFPTVGAEFHTGLAGVQWISLAYLLTLVTLLTPLGRVADVFGRKQCYLYGFAVFTVASAVCGLATSLPMLIGCRVLQAVGAALLQANSVALVTTAVEPGRRRTALGVQAAAQALGLALGPLVGGALVATVGWRWVYLVNLPIGVIGLLAGYFLLPRTWQRSERCRFDALGPLLLAVGASALLLGLSTVSGLTLPAAAGAGLLVAAVLVLGAFGWWQTRSDAPLIPPWVLRTRAVAAGLIAALFGYLVLFGPLVLVPVVLTARGESGVVIGAVTTALPVGFALAATCAGLVLPGEWSGRRRGVLGGVVCLISLVLLAFLGSDVIALTLLLVLLGLGLGVFTPANNALVMSAIPVTSAGLGGGLVNMARGIGTALGVAVVTLVAHLVIGNALGAAAFGALAICAVLLTVSAARS
jgi:MFS family permease